MRKGLSILSIALIIILIIIVLELFVFRLPDVGFALEGKLNSVQTKAVDLLIDITTLFITFCLGIIGALSFFIRERKNSFSSYSGYQIFFLVACGGSAILSIYFGHLIFTAIVEMLGNDFLDIFSSLILWCTRLQYLFLLVSIVFLIAFVFTESFTVGNKRGSDDSL